MVPRHKTTPEQRDEGRRLAASIRDARAAASEPQSVIAERSGVSLDTIRAIEGDRVMSPSFMTVARVARALDVPLDRLALAALISRPAKRKSRKAS